jgi:group I intron endonuclease
MFVYKITNKINNKVYVGYDSYSKNKQHRRWIAHRYNYKNEKARDYNKVLYKAMRKYGIENFIFEVLEECFTFTFLKEREIFWIKYYKSTERKFC